MVKHGVNLYLEDEYISRARILGYDVSQRVNDFLKALTEREFSNIKSLDKRKAELLKLRKNVKADLTTIDDEIKDINQKMQISQQEATKKAIEEEERRKAEEERKAKIAEEERRILEQKQKQEVIIKAIESQKDLVEKIKELPHEKDINGILKIDMEYRKRNIKNIKTADISEYYIKIKAKT